MVSVVLFILLLLLLCIFYFDLLLIDDLVELVNSLLFQSIFLIELPFMSEFYLLNLIL